MKKSMLLLAFIGTACLLNACGGSGGSTQIGVVTHFSVTAPAAVSIGEYFNLTVTALDNQNNLVTSYSGFVQFSSTDPNVPLPGNNALASAAQARRRIRRLKLDSYPRRLFWNLGRRRRQALQGSYARGIRIANFLYVLSVPVRSFHLWNETARRTLINAVNPIDAQMVFFGSFQKVD